MRVPAILLTLLLLAVARSAVAAEQTVDSKVTDVVVYPEHAQVTRSIELELEAGDHALIFSDLAGTLDAKSVRATADGAVELTGTEIRTRYLSEASSEALAEFDKRLEAAQDALAVLQREAAQWQQEKQFYAAIKASTSAEIAEGMERKSLSIDEWKQVLAFVREGTQETDTQLQRLDQSIRTQQREVQRIAREREQYLSISPKEMKEILVGVHAPRKGKAVIRVHYLVPNATWRPVYDIALADGGRSARIVGYAMVSQSTGEEWDNVRLSLAMAQPDSELSLPELAPVIATLDPSEMGQIAQDVQALNEVKDAEYWASNRFQSKQQRQRFESNLKQLACQQEQELNQYGLRLEDVQRAIRRLGGRFGNTRYTLPRAESILSNRTPHKVTIFTTETPVDLKYVASPSLGDTVVRRGDMRNQLEHALIEGECSIFVGGSYVGFASLPSIAPNEPFSVYFGADDGLKAARTLATTDVKGPERFRQSRVAEYQYRIDVTSFKKDAVTVEIHDQIPIAQTTDIQVRMVSSTVEYRLDDRGELVWTLEVAPEQRTAIDFRYQIEYPVSQGLYFK